MSFQNELRKWQMDYPKIGLSGEIDESSSIALGGERYQGEVWSHNQEADPTCIETNVRRGGLLGVVPDRL